MTNTAVMGKLRRWMTMLEALLANGGSSGVVKSRVRELGICRGAQAIWVDKEQAGAVTSQGTGVS